MTIAEVRNVTRSYGSGPARVHALRDVSLTIEPGEFTVFKGPSGSGKTTLLNQIGCLDAPTEGELFIDGQSTRNLSSRALSKLRAQKIGFIFQSFNLVPVLSAQENVELAMELAGHTEGRAEAAREMLAQVGLAGLEHRRPSQLSGGQQQRVAIARALVKKPVLIIADEPTANLDSENGEQVIAAMQKLNREIGITFLFSSHDPRVIAHARRVVTLRDGRVVSDEVGRETHAEPAPVERAS
jgi:putative ABC transport system ATP-binding protein